MRVINHHSFNTAVAEDFGVEKAIILEHFVFWVRKNYANRKNIYKDGKPAPRKSNLCASPSPQPGSRSPFLRTNLRTLFGEMGEKR